MEAKNDEERGKELAIAGAAEMAGAGVGGALGAIGGPPGIAAGAIGGVAATRLFKWVGSEFVPRLLSHRQKVRAGGALAVAVTRIHERENSGEVRRADGVFDPREDGPSDADELLEGTLLHAAQSYEERKVQFLGRLYASFEFDGSISPGYANFLIRLLERLTYRQLAALSFIGDEARETERALLGADQIGSGIGSARSIIAELGELGTAGLIGFQQTDGSVTTPANVWGEGRIDMNTIGQIGLTDTGKDLYRLAELNALPNADQNEVVAALRGEGG